MGGNTQPPLLHFATLEFEMRSAAARGDLQPLPLQHVLEMPLLAKKKKLWVTVVLVYGAAAAAAVVVLWWLL